MHNIEIKATTTMQQLKELIFIHGKVHSDKETHAEAENTIYG
jgi:hypothetical protein